jgi:hypothetical protein
MDSRFDDLLHTVITEKGQGIYGFFDVVFGFMYKRTDFFYEMAPGENMGFFPGQAEAIVYNYFRKYQNTHYKERVPKRNIDPKEIEEFMKSQKDKTSKLEPKITEVKAISTPETESVQSIPVKIKPEIKVEPKQIPKTDKPVDSSFSSISTYNGDKCDLYNWSQGIMDINIQIQLPEATKKKDVYYINHSLILQ